MALTPDLELRFDGRTLSATGDLRVPTARIEYLRKLAAVPASPDVVVVGREREPERAPRIAVEARVRLVLGEQVRLKAMGFEGRVRGSILLDDRPGRPPSGTGEIVVDEGTYEAYGAELTIERGRLRFAGPLDNPGLDLKAFRKADDGTIAGVIVQGSLRKPDVQVYSEPPMSQSDALAYVILGHPLDQATPAEGSLVSRVATSAGITGANLLGKQAARQFGLETMRIESEQGLEEASLVVGKYLSPRIYLEYGIGLLDQASQLRVNYILNKRWSLRAETGEANAGDVFYTIER
jgi:translocation and assembly module TamB